MQHIDKQDIDVDNNETIILTLFAHVNASSKKKQPFVAPCQFHPTKLAISASCVSENFENSHSFNRQLFRLFIEEIIMVLLLFRPFPTSKCHKVLIFI